MNKSWTTATVFILFITVTISYGQKLTVAVDTTVITDSVGRKMIPIRQGMDQAKTMTDFNKKAASYMQLTDSSVVKRIYSEKRLQQVQDSLAKLGQMYKVAEVMRRREVPEAEVIDLINQKFPHKAQFEDKVKKEQSQQIKDPENEFKVLKEEEFKKHDITSYTLPIEEQLTLTPLPGNIIKNKYLKKADSLRRINLKEEKLQLKEAKSNAHAKVSVIREKPSFWQKSYFEGILGFASGKEITLYQASPALGYHFTDFFSLGVGPTLQVQATSSKFLWNTGLRTFSKLEFLKKQVYLQAEDSINPIHGSSEGLAMDKHNILVGGGFLLSVKAPVTLNFSILYNVNENKMNVSEITPFVFRLGISTVKLDK